jgi:YfiH family protein
MTFERRPIGHDAHALVSTTLEDAGFLAAFTERTGGASEDPYGSLNLAFHVGDEPEPVRENRRLVCEGLGIEAFATTEQVHGSRVVKVGGKRAAAGFEDPAGALAAADAMTTSSSGVAMAILAADCVPVVAASTKSGMLVAAHAGWRGIAEGIVRNVASLFDAPKDVRVALGPAIGPDHYEVGEDVALAVASGTDAGAVLDRSGGKVRLDLVGTIRAELRALGIRSVDDTGLCTACEQARFFSYRRDEVTGRQAGIAVKLPK